jgi:hypothetical protein
MECRGYIHLSLLQQPCSTVLPSSAAPQCACVLAAVDLHRMCRVYGPPASYHHRQPSWKPTSLQCSSSSSSSTKQHTAVQGSCGTGQCSTAAALQLTAAASATGTPTAPSNTRPGKTDEQRQQQWGCPGALPGRKPLCIVCLEALRPAAAAAGQPQAASSCRCRQHCHSSRDSSSSSSSICIPSDCGAWVCVCVPHQLPTPVLLQRSGGSVRPGTHTTTFCR